MIFISVIKAEDGKKVIKIVAAENVYGGIAKQIGGSSVEVTSILNNLQQDPHEFQVDSATAMAIADADVVIYNGIGYDSWMEKILLMQGSKTCHVIKVSDLVSSKPGDNPHLWYDPRAITLLTKNVSSLLAKPSAFDEFTISMKPLLEKMACLKKKYAGTKVTATEPLFGPMAEALGLDMINKGYQLAVMNGTEPSFQQTADFQESLINKKVRLLFYNSQVVDPSTKRMQSIAQQNDISIIGVTEIQPPTAKNYQEWMMGELTQVEKALNSIQKR